MRRRIYDRKKTLSPDPVLKAYWRNNERFADLFNQIFFDGKDFVLPEALSDGETDQANMLLEKKTVFTVSGLRDLYKKHVQDAVLAIYGLENQTEIHYAMPVRTMLLDAVDYSKQYKTISQEHRQAKDLKSSAELLSGMKQEDRILPVLTLIIYYGEDAWQKPETLWDMMDIPDELKPFINNYRIHIFQIRDCGQYSFSHPDNQDFFTLISEFYTQKKAF